MSQSRTRLKALFFFLFLLLISFNANFMHFRILRVQAKENGTHDVFHIRKFMFQALESTEGRY